MVKTSVVKEKVLEVVKDENCAWQVINKQNKYVCIELDGGILELPVDDAFLLAEQLNNVIDKDLKVEREARLAKKKADLVVRIKKLQDKLIALG